MKLKKYDDWGKKIEKKKCEKKRNSRKLTSNETIKISELSSLQWVVQKIYLLDREYWEYVTDKVLGVQGITNDIGKRREKKVKDETTSLWKRNSPGRRKTGRYPIYSKIIEFMVEQNVVAVYTFDSRRGWTRWKLHHSNDLTSRRNQLRIRIIPSDFTSAPPVTSSTLYKYYLPN